MSEVIRLYLFDSNTPHPRHATKESAGLDVWASDMDTPTFRRIRHTSLYLLPEDHPTVPKAVWASDPIPEGFFIEIRPRSSSFKQEIYVFQGTIDRDYRGEIGIGISGCPIPTNDKPIAQLVLTPYRQFCAPQAVVREGGFGSTDAKR